MPLLQLSITFITIKFHGALANYQVPLNPIEISNLFFNVLVIMNTFYLPANPRKKKLEDVLNFYFFYFDIYVDCLSQMSKERKS